MESRKSVGGAIGTGEMTELVAAFERQNDCRIEITLLTVTWQKELCLMAEAVAWSKANASGARLRLASVNVRCQEQRLATFEAVILNLLYALDFKLAEREFERANKKRA